MRILIFIALLVCIEARRAKHGYKESFTYATFRHRSAPERQKTVCANYLQYKKQFLPENEQDAPFHSLKWWHDKKWNTKVCPTGFPGQFNYSGTVVPLDYRIAPDGSNCTMQITRQDIKQAAQFEVDQLQLNNADAGILLMEKGRRYFTNWRDSLFADFTDPYINTSLPTFFMYAETLKGALTALEADDGDDIEIAFHRPQDNLVDLSMFIIWLLAMGCVAGGGAWAFHRQRLGKDKPTLPSDQPSSSAAAARGDSESVTSDAAVEKSCCSQVFAKHANSIAIVVLMVFLVAVLMTGFFFRTYLVGIFNVLVTIIGSTSVFQCVRAFLSNFTCITDRSFYKAKPPIPAKILSWMSSHPSYLDIVIYLSSLTMCICWYIYRKDPYAFILLDIINVTLCLHILKSLRLPSVRWISVLMACMFVYDAVMVFVTPAFTSNGCSVMLEVATGIDCNSNKDGYPMPPIDATQPEKFPMLMQVMPLDPMMDCMDLEVETSYPMTILGLGDIIIPGYLVTHCFTMAGFLDRIRLIYGIVCVIGYGAGLIITFMALTLMHMAQPALIYLVPCTLIPIYTLAAIRGEFRKLWFGGQDDDKTITVSDTETIHLSSDDTNSIPATEL